MAFSFVREEVHVTTSLPVKQGQHIETFTKPAYGE
jgi:hypothetical protein